MTLTHDPDEDAANLDDVALLEAYLDDSTSQAIPATEAGPEMPEWPPVTMRNVGLTIETATLAWFRSHHADWRREMGFVLSAWVAAQGTSLRNDVTADLERDHAERNVPRPKGDLFAR